MDNLQRTKRVSAVKPKGRALKAKIQHVLTSTSIVRALEEILKIPGRQAVNPLFSFLYHQDTQLKWAAVTAMGAVVAKLADADMEEARIIMRRLMWNLNDESGGIGWGSPEAMGEILARHKGLADEYKDVLMSYTHKDTNYLEHEMLQRGLLWGICRLARTRPGLLKRASSRIIPYLDSPDAHVRGMAAKVAGLLKIRDAVLMLGKRIHDEKPLEIYADGALAQTRVKDLAKEALGIICAHP